MVSISINMILNILKIFGLSTLTFFVAIAMTPILTHYLYKYKMWKKISRSNSSNTVGDAFKKIHNEEAEMSTPRVGGILIWSSVFLISFLTWFISVIFPNEISLKINFLSQNQTWIPLFVLITASIIGLIDDLFQIFNSRKDELSTGGIPRFVRILSVLIIGALCGLWFFLKLDMHSINIPFFSDIELGWFFVPFFAIVMFVVFSGGVIDGIDGLAGGLIASVFAAYGGIAFFQNQIDIATFCAVTTGGILAFLWFNIPPARFYMGETGMLGLTATLTVIAFLTKSVAVLPIIALPFFVASASAFIQMMSKKYFGKKVFKVAPIHHHFMAIGWPSQKVTMRFWIIGIISAVIGMIVALIG